jgi:hypothetical protein
VKQIRKRLTYANVMSTIAVFSLVGGASAFAAVELAKNSVGTKQIKKNAINSAKVKNGSLLAGDFKAGQLPKGATGPQGPKGDIGPAGPLLETLPSGKSEKGAYGFASTRFESGGLVYTPGIETSYPIPISFKPTIQIVKSGAASTPQCPGSRTQPSAAPGFLCLYEEREDVQLSVENLPAEGHFGFLVFFLANKGENYEDHGTWAVTAP